MKRVLQSAAVLAVVASSVFVATDAKACLFGGCGCRRSCCYQPVVYQAYYAPACGCSSYGGGYGGGCSTCGYGGGYGGGYYTNYQPVYAPVYAVQPAYYAAPVAAYPAPYRYDYRQVGNHVRIRERY